LDWICINNSFQTPRKFKVDYNYFNIHFSEASGNSVAENIYIGKAQIEMNNITIKSFVERV